MRIGKLFDLGQVKFEPYVKASVIEEFLTGNTVVLDNQTFDTHLNGTVGQAAIGATVVLRRNLSVYGEYDYTNGQHYASPWHVTMGVRFSW